MNMIRRVTSGSTAFYRSVSWSRGNGSSFGSGIYANSHHAGKLRGYAFRSSFAYGHAWRDVCMDAASFRHQGFFS